jgi:hypothetical protein
MRERRLQSTILSSCQDEWTVTQNNILRAVSQFRWLVAGTAAARVRVQFRSCGICGGQNGTGVDFLRLLWFPLKILIPPTAPRSLSITRDWYNRPKECPRYQVDSGSPRPKKLKSNTHWVLTILHQEGWGPARALSPNACAFVTRWPGTSLWTVIYF